MKNIFIKLCHDPRVKNSLWMFFEKAISLFGLIFIISAVAKFTGPKIYGEISLAASVFIVVKTVAQLGLDQVYFKYVSSNKLYYDFFLKNSIKIISLIYCIVSLLVVFIAYFSSSSTGIWFIVATCVAYYFNSIDLVNFYYEGKLLAKINVVANVVGLILALTIRYLIVIFKINVLFLCIPIVVMTIVPFFLKFYIYEKKFSLQSRKTIAKKNNKYFKYLIYTGFPLTISALTITVNSQIANYFIAYFNGTYEVGIFSIAFILAGAWCIIPTTLMMSYLTTIYNIDDEIEYINLSRKVYFFIFSISVLLVLTLLILADFIIEILYGPEYKSSVQVMQILLFYQFFWVLGYYFSRLIIKFNGFRFLAVKSILSCVLNVIMTYILVRRYGVVGAAYSILLVEIFSTVFLCLLYKKANLIKIMLPFGRNTI